MQFPVQKDPQRLSIIVLMSVAFGIFVVLAFLVAGGTAGIVLLVLSGTMLIGFVLEQAKAGWIYEINPDGIVVRRTVKRYAISAERLKAVRKVGWPEIRKRIEAYRRGEAGLTGAGRQVALGRLIGFSAIPIPLRGGDSSPRDSTGHGPRSRERFVLLSLEDGREYILSPVDTEQFYRECQRLISRGQPG